MTENNSSHSSNRTRETHPAEDTRPERELLQHVVERLGIERYDLLLIGDGSGSGWTQSCGWASLLIDKNNILGRGVQARRLFYGAMNQGSVNLAESMPYLQAIQWYDVNFGKALLQQWGILRVHILTDSQTIANWGTKAMNPAAPPPRKGLVVWASLREYCRLGYHFTMHWAPRLTTEMNWAADLIAGLARKEMSQALGLPLDATLTDKAAHSLDQVLFRQPCTGFDPYHYNPSEEV